jgi:multicomponent Na+:H+ antiporter subunit G
MLAVFVPWLADALVLLGLAVLTIAVWGMLRMPDLYTSLHAASKAAAFGIAPLLIAAGLENRTILLRGLLVLGFLLLTSPVSAHAIARAYWRNEQRASGREPSSPDSPSGQPTGPSTDL